MLVTTRAIVLRTVRHGDHKVILTAWTAHAGVRSYLVRAGGERGASPATLQPLARIELVVDERADRELHFVREIRVAEPYVRIHTEPVRGTVLLFAQEVLFKVLRTESPDPGLDAFVHETLQVIDTADDLRCFPLVFLLQLSGHLGFYPEHPVDEADHFDLQEGSFVNGAARHGHTMGPPLSTALAQLLNVPLQDLSTARMGAAERASLLDHLLLYHRLHVEGFGELRSVAVLRSVLS